MRLIGNDLQNTSMQLNLYLYKRQINYFLHMFHCQQHMLSCNSMRELSYLLYFHNNNLIHPSQVIIYYCYYLI